ncbi:flagellar hook-associated protein FlgL [Cellvibrio polysaccharolyticus]|uniref:Flagellar hook-associated protein 3 n=1 Tax=Cellvibrio polysaccharolyticus TaxID=2082724 RepID=A0A928YVY7_9GAMM|nr:flagellar hook-associated protein FlgL [Cellvibrio polysaccharolyticus]MBE8717613.1 flagellar hook-associated protein 3 [Cellvibrio polysaccharolyticus]
MRVSTSQIYNIANISMRDAQTAVTRSQEQIASGKKLMSPADDPVAAATILQLKQEMARIEQYGKNINIAENNLGVEDAALKSIVNLVQRMQELGVASGNTAVMTASDYKSFASEVDSRIDELLGLQNTKNYSGQYIFAGYQGDTKPFVSNGMGQVSYHGDEGQLSLQASANVNVAVNDSGKKLFIDIPSSHNTFTTQSNPANRSAPAASIGVGSVVDQTDYDKLFPENLTIVFNDPNAVTPPGMNYTVTERGSGKVLAANQPYTSGKDIEVAGIKVPVYGNPAAPVPASLSFGAAGAGADYSSSPTTLTLSVNGQRETFVINGNFTGATDGSALAAVLNDAGNGNAAKLQRLGLTADANGITAAKGMNITVSGGNAGLDAITGLNTQGAGTTSVNGLPGDSFEVNSSNKEALLTTLSRFSEALKNVKDTPESKAEFSKIVAQVLNNLGNSVTQISAVQGEVGARLNTLESAKDLNIETNLTNKKVLSDIEDLDYAEASIKLAMESYVLSAAQQSFAKVSQLTLFSYLR